MITVVLQMAVILLTGSFYAYLLTAAAVELIQKIFVSRYLDRRYPYLRDRDVKKLSPKETGEIVTKTRALVFHKVGDVARLQTDSMIITGFINAAVSSFVDNYNMVLNSVANVVNIILTPCSQALGISLPRRADRSSIRSSGSTVLRPAGSTDSPPWAFPCF